MQYINTALNYLNNSDRVVLVALGLVLTSVYAPIVASIAAVVSQGRSLLGSVRGTIQGYQALITHYVYQFPKAYAADRRRLGFGPKALTHG